MNSSFTDEMAEIIIAEYPDGDNETLAKKLGISQGSLRWRASQLSVKKSESFMKDYYSKLHQNRRNYLNKNRKNYSMDDIERNIIIGSVLGDGTLSKYGRSLNALYRESTGKTQKSYRKWKAEKLRNLDFKIKPDGSIYSPSHPIYTKLYELFYPNGKKTLSENGLKMLDHPIGLACLFMDDGSLITNGSLGANTVTITANIPIYSQSFTKEENILLLEHIKDTFGIEFKLAKIPSGYGYHLLIGKNQTVRKFLDIVKPYVNEIPSMRYKINIDEKLVDTKNRYAIRYPDKIIKIANKVTIDNSYSQDEENRIIELIELGYSYKYISKLLNRTYYGLYDKVRRMKKENKI
ncbi:MAG: hypothetical protein WCZ27_02710 [Tissierellaceae bacterium]